MGSIELSWSIFLLYMELLGKFSLLCSSIPFVEIPFIVVKHALFCYDFFDFAREQCYWQSITFFLICNSSLGSLASIILSTGCNFSREVENFMSFLI